MSAKLSNRHPAAWPGALVAATLLGLWLGFGVSAGELARFAAYEVLLVGLPGILCYRALSPSPGGPLRQIAIGWPLGYAIGLAGFALTAALDVRGMFVAVPLLAAAVAALPLRRSARSRPADPPEPDAPRPALGRGPAWAVAAAVCLGLVYLAVGYFTETPLPGEAASVSYYIDNVYDLALIAEARNHWPMQNPNVSGEPMHYHVYAFMHLAAVSQVTGVDPGTLLFRLFPATLLVLVTLQVAALGRALGPRAWAGPLAAGLVLVAGELDLDPGSASPLADSFFASLPQSPTFLFGVPLFLASVTVLLGVLASRESPGARTWLLLGVLLLAAGGAKASILPVILGGLVLWLGWTWLRERAAPRPALIALAVAGAASAVTYVLVYAGGSGAGLELEPFQFMEFTVFDDLVDPERSGSLGAVVLRVGLGALTLLALVLPVLGILWVLRERGWGLEPAQAWLLALFLAGLGAFVALGQVGQSQSYFLYYGYIAGCALSAHGIAGFLDRSRKIWERPGHVLAWAVLGALGIGAVAAALLHMPGPESAGPARLGLVYALVALGIAGVAWLASRAAVTELAAGAAGAALLAAISLGILNTPLDDGAPAAEKLEAGEPLALEDRPEHPGMTEDLYEGLRWVRDNSEEDDVIAVNNDSGRYFYYAGFAERRTFLGAWLYTAEAHRLGYEEVAAGEKVAFPARQELNAAVFQDADRKALRTLTDEYGVGLLVVDKLRGSASPEVARLGDPLFENDALLVIGVRPPRDGERPR